MIFFDDVSFSYGGGEPPVLERLSLRIPAGEHAALMGPSGCGKSSLLKLAAGLLTPTEGAVRVNAERLAFVFQEPRLLPGRTALQNVNAVLGDGRATLPEAAHWLDRVGLAEAADKYPAELSGGMAQRVNIARALACGSPLLLLDEPFQGVDEERKADILALLREYAADRTLLLATHDRAEAEALCSRILTYTEKRFIPV